MDTEEIVIDTKDKIKLICQAADDTKAEGIVVMDMTKTSSICSYFVVLSASSTVRVKAIADYVEDELRKYEIRPAHKEGYAEALWVLMDYGDVALHAFHEEVRGFYNLEKLWGDVPQRKFVPQAHHKGKN